MMVVDDMDTQESPYLFVILHSSVDVYRLCLRLHSFFSLFVPKLVLMERKLLDSLLLNSLFLLMEVFLDFPFVQLVSSLLSSEMA